jgi:hypothetical protein
MCYGKGGGLPAKCKGDPMRRDRFFSRQEEKNKGGWVMRKGVEKASKTKQKQECVF